MGTNFFYDEMHPTEDLRGREAQRQLEIFRPSGEEYIVIRIGNIDQQHAGEGSSVRIDKAHAEELLIGLERALSYFGWVK